eukprot:COSAG06_NODE_36261_length_449_cov_1.174286_1_plen_100_part_10
MKHPGLVVLAGFGVVASSLAAVELGYLLLTDVDLICRADLNREVERGWIDDAVAWASVRCHSALLTVVMWRAIGLSGLSEVFCSSERTRTALQEDGEAGP